MFWLKTEDKLVDVKQIIGEKELNSTDIETEKGCVVNHTSYRYQIVSLSSS